MGISREQLKEIVKECLVEILSDGINNVGSLVTERRVATARAVLPQRQSRSSPLDERVGGSPALAHVPNNLLKSSVKIAAGGNKLMEAIFADSAMTTLQTQLSNGETMDPGNTGAGGGARGGLQQVEKIVGTPEEVFGADATARWADLAFAEGSAKKSA